MSSMVSDRKPVDRNRVALAAERLSLYADLKERKNWRYVWDKLVEYGWHEEPLIVRSLVGAPAEWLREIGHVPPEDTLADLAAAGSGLEVAYTDGSIRRIMPEDMPLIAMIVETLRLFPGSSIAVDGAEIGRRRWPRRKETTA